MKPKLIFAIGMCTILLAGAAVASVACSSTKGSVTDTQQSQIAKVKEQKVTIEANSEEFAANKQISKSVEVPLGGSVVVKLWSNKTTGFSWTDAAVLSDPAVLEQTDHEFLAPEGGMMGAAGTEVWTFKTLKAGPCSLTMTYSQPWEGGEKDANTFSLDVLVIVS